LPFMIYDTTGCKLRVFSVKSCQLTVFLLIFLFLILTSDFCLFNLGILGNLAHFRHLFTYLLIPNKSIFQERPLGIT
jgi:hypothetical protein